MSKIYVYKITSPSGRAYVGISVDVRRRFAGHKRDARRGSLHPLHCAMRKYAEALFALEVLEEHDTVEAAQAAEIAAITAHRTLLPDGYNISPGGDYDGAAGGEAVKAMLAVDPVYRAKRTAIGRASVGALKDWRIKREIERNRATHPTLRYVVCDRTDGVERHYFRVKGRPKVRLPDPAWSNAFVAAYRAQVKRLVEERANKSVQPNAGLTKQVSSRPNQADNNLILLDDFRRI